jgi:hypothetical protein
MKIYIGQSIQYKSRVSSHIYSKDNTYFHRSIRKYGVENFGFCIIHDNIDTMWLDDWEIYYINKYNSTDKNVGFNMTEGGGGSHGLKRTEETCKKISEAQTGRKVSEETRKKMSERIITEETRKKMSEARTGRKVSEETLKKISEAQTGRKVSEETRKKISESKKGKKHSEETLKKISESNKGKKHSEETRKKISKRVVQYDLEMKEISKYNSMIEASIKTGVHQSKISLCCNGKRKTTGEFIWKFAESSEQV